MIPGASIAMPVFATKVESEGVNTLKRRYLPAGILFHTISIIILISFSSLHNNASAQNPYLHFAFNIGSDASDNGESVVADHSGNIYTTGYFTGTCDFDPGPGVVNLVATAGNSNIYVAKYTVAGAYQWAFSIPNSDVYGDGHCIFVDAAGNLYVSGSFMGTADFDPGAGVASLTSNGSTDIFVAKYSSSGAYQWAIDIGGIDPDFGYSVTADALGNVYVTGDFENTVDFDPGPGTANLIATGIQDVFVAKYNAAGAYQWAFPIGTSFASNDGLSITVDALSNVYVTGTFYAATDFDPGPGIATVSSSGANDIFLAKYNSSGVYQWAFGIGGTTSDVGYCVAIDGGNVYLSGYYKGTADFDPGPANADLSGSGAFLAKYDAAGIYQWAFPINYTGVGGAVNIGTSISFDIAGNVFLTGRFSNTADFNPGAATANVTATGQTDIFVAKYTAAGNYLFAFAVGGAGGTNVGNSVAIDGASIYVTGNFKGTADFDPKATTTNLTSNTNSSDIFLAKYSPCPLAASPGPITGNANVCGGSLNSYSIAAVPGALSYTWTLPVGWIGISNTTTINTIAGNSGGVISVVANDICGPSSPQTLSVIANPVLTSAVNLFANPAGIICEGKPVKFTAVSIGTAPASNYDFKVNGVTVQTGTDTTYTTSSLANGDQVTVTITTVGACVPSPTAVSNTITVPVQASTAKVNLVASNYGPVCQGTPIQFTATASDLNGGSVLNYDFRINGGNNQSGPSNVFDWSGLYGGDVTCTIRVIGGTCLTTPTATSNIIPLLVHPTPVISFFPPDRITTAGTTIQLNPHVSVSGGTYLWTPITGLNDPTAPNPLSTPAVTTTYNLHFVSAGGCVADKTIKVKVVNEIYIPNAFVPNGVAVNRVFRVPPGTSLQLEYFRVYDRFGNLLFSTSDVNEGWDGNYKGKPASMGSYVYLLKGTDHRGEVALKGTVMLIR